LPVPGTPSIDATLEVKDGHTIATDTQTIVTAAGGTLSITFILRRLKFVQRVLNFSVVNTSNLVAAGMVSKTDIDGNVVGITLISVGGGTTLTALLTAIGV